MRVFSLAIKRTKAPTAGRIQFIDRTAPATGLAVLSMVCIGLLVMVVLLGLQAGRNVLNQWEITHFVPASGTIDASNYERVSRGSGRRRRTDYYFYVQYTYEYLGNTYSGRAFDALDLRGGSKVDRGWVRAKGLVARFPPGLAAAVYVDPNDPSRSVLENNVYTYHAEGFTFVLPAATALLIFGVDCLIVMWAPLRNFPHGGVPARSEGDLVRVQLTTKGPRRFGKYCALAWTLLISLVFVLIHWLTSFDIAIEWMIGLYAFALPLGVIGGAVRLAWLRTGCDDLVINVRSRTISFADPWKPGFENHPIAEVTSISTGERIWQSKGRPHRTGTYVEIDFRSRGPYRLITWYEDRRADAFGAWLAEVLNKVEGGSAR